jgi:hypothetical protein
MNIIQAGVLPQRFATGLPLHRGRQERERQAAMDATESPQVPAEGQVLGHRLAQEHARRVRRRRGGDLLAARGAADGMTGGCRVPVVHHGLLAVLAADG